MNKKTLNNSKENNEKNPNKSHYPDEEFKEYLNQLASPNYQGGSWSLPENPTLLEKSKYELCREILIYQQDNNLSDEIIAERMELTLGETADILYYRTAYFTLDRLMTYANKLFRLEPMKVEIIKEKKEVNGRRKMV